MGFSIRDQSSFDFSPNQFLGLRRTCLKHPKRETSEKKVVRLYRSTRQKKKTEVKIITHRTSNRANNTDYSRRKRVLSLVYSRSP